MTLGQITDCLREAGHAVKVVRPRQAGSDSGGDFTVTGVPIPCYPDLRLGLPSPSRLRRLWCSASDRPDLVHIATEGPLGWSALRVAHALSLPVTSSFHTNFHAYGAHYGVGRLKRPVLAYLRWFHNRTLATFAPTTEICSELESAGFKRMRVLGRGVDTGRFDPVHRSSALRRQWTGRELDAPVAIVVGRVAAEKNLKLAILAFRAMQAVDPRCRLVVVGDGPLRTKLMAANPDIIFAGARRGMELAEYYASADIFLFPSLTETYGNVVAEAMASSLAVVAFDYAAARMHITDGCNGRTVPVADERAFISTAVSLIRPPRDPSTHALEQLVMMRAAARLTAQSLSWETIVRDFARQLEALVSPTTTEAATALT